MSNHGVVSIQCQHHQATAIFVPGQLPPESVPALETRGRVLYVFAEEHPQSRLTELRLVAWAIQFAQSSGQTPWEMKFFPCDGDPAFAIVRFITSPSANTPARDPPAT